MHRLPQSRSKRVLGLQTGEVAESALEDGSRDITGRYSDEE
ncbi:hypothetical protein J2848_003106 [Azospirillum lipoferum]|nr:MULTISPECIES: hypothetical protein [Azospirillum]MCP1611433.1 hypothetical protein [Azospirillum lipoferum]MDW5537235.1 hypothetical protein [Azospirillum sp. NL1]